MNWEALARHGDDESTVRAALLAEFDLRWTDISRDIRRQLLAQGLDLANALACVEAVHALFRGDAASQAAATVDRMAAGALTQH